MAQRATTIAMLGAGLLLLGSLAPNGRAQDEPSGAEPATPLPPDLVSVLRDAPGCLGVDVAPRTANGRSVVFAWFESKQALLSWYHAEPHQAMLERFFPRLDRAATQPLDEVPDDVGPIMVVASVTRAERGRLPETTLPVSQVSIELYRPLPGGVRLGGGFAPEGLRVEPPAREAPAGGAG